MTESDGRHVGLSVIEDYLARGLDGVLAVDGDPPGQVLIDGHKSVLAVRVPAEGHAPDVTAFEKLDIELVHDEGAMWHRMSVQVDDNAGDVYSVLCRVLDRIQLSGRSFSDAVDEVLVSLAELLATRHHLTREQEVGLFGELVVFHAIAHQLGPDQALSSWRGPFGEEHDFGLADVDLEVKVTLGEARHHWISSLTQLVPTGARPLHLVSIQLTRAGVDAGATLPALVGSARSIATLSVAHLDEMLVRVGYRDRDADLYGARWTLRTDPAFYRVDEGFPAITPARLNDAIPGAHHILDVRYRLDVTAMAEASPLFTLNLPQLLEGRK